MAEQERDQYRQHFRQNSDTLRDGIKGQRQINDKFCCVVFLLILLVLLILGLFVIIDQGDRLNANSNKNLSNGDKATSSNIYAIVFANYNGVIAVCWVLALLFAFVYVALLRCFPKCMVYSLIIIVFSIMFAILCISISNDSIGVAVTMAIAIALFAIFLFCARQHLQTGIDLLELSGQFIWQNCAVYWIPVWVFFLTSVFYVFWMVSFVAAQLKADQSISQGKSTADQNGIMAYFIFTHIFMVFLFYYVLTFLLATACAVWFYRSEVNYFTTGTCNLTKYHMGSITFAAMVVAIIKMLRIILTAHTSSDPSSNGCAACMNSCVQCLLGCVQHIVQAMNSVAVISMALTGQNYCDSIKTGAYLIRDNLGLYWVVSMIGNIILFAGIIISGGLATLIAVIHVDRNYPDITQQEQDHLGVIVLFGSMIIVLFTVGLLVQAIECIFVFSCLNNKLTKLGIIVSNSETLQKVDALNRSHQEEPKLRKDQEKSIHQEKQSNIGQRQSNIPQKRSNILERNTNVEEIQSNVHEKSHLQEKSKVSEDKHLDKKEERMSGQTWKSGIRSQSEYKKTPQSAPVDTRPKNTKLDSASSLSSLSDC